MALQRGQQVPREVESPHGARAEPAPDGGQEKHGAQAADFFHDVCDVGALGEGSDGEEAHHGGFHPGAGCVGEVAFVLGEAAVEQDELGGVVEDGDPVLHGWETLLPLEGDGVEGSGGPWGRSGVGLPYIGERDEGGQVLGERSDEVCP